MKKIVIIFVVMVGFGSFGANANSVLAGDDFPLGYPYSSWGELSYGWGDVDEGLLLEGYVEQGVDWVQKNQWIIDTFIGLRFNASSEQGAYWNNKIGPWIGLKVSHPIWSPGWGNISLGVRGEFYHYNTSSAPNNNDSRLTAFLQWSFGGDWKTRR